MTYVICKISCMYKHKLEVLTCEQDSLIKSAIISRHAKKDCVTSWAKRASAKEARKRIVQYKILIQVHTMLLILANKVIHERGKNNWETSKQTKIRIQMDVWTDGSEGQQVPRNQADNQTDRKTTRKKLKKQRKKERKKSFVARSRPLNVYFTSLFRTITLFI